MWNSKTLKIQNMYIWKFRILKLQECFITYKWGEMYMIYWKKNHITLNSTFQNNIFWYDFKLSSFFKMKHKNCKESIHFYKFIFIKKWLRKIIDLLGQFWSFFIASRKNNHSKRHSYEKLFWGERTCNPNVK